MNILLDTHVLIWALENNPTLTERAVNAIVDGNNMVFYIHKDPFDRMLIAQAIIEKLVLLTRDESIAKYDVTILKA